MTEDVFRKLQEHLNRHPIGFPKAESGVDIRLLKKMFDEEDAKIALALFPKPETPEEIAARLGYDPKTMAEKLDQMAKKGLAMRRRKNDKVFYNLEPFVFGMMEFQLGRLDKEFIDLGGQFYLESFLSELSSGKTPYFRVIPIEESLPSDVVIYPYETVSEIIDQASKIAVADCFCRTNAKMQGRECEQTQVIQNCMFFSDHAEFYIENGWPGRLVGKEEALDIIKQADEDGLVHNSQNAASGQFFICNCCSCCCGITTVVKMLNLHGKLAARSDFYAGLDEDACTGCEECVPRCPFDAISMADEIASVNRDLCMGCGLCTSACTTAAIYLSRKPEDQLIQPPSDVEAMFAQIGKEKGRSMKVQLT